jgi:hypothetical protein
MCLKNIAICLMVIVCIWSISACGGAAAEDKARQVLSTQQAKKLLLELPYQYRFRRAEVPVGASGALAGRATNAQGIFLNFGVALGRTPDPVPVPQAGTNSAYGYPDGGFVFTDDLLVSGAHGHWHIPNRFHGKAEWNEAGHMGVVMEEQLCKAVTSKPCPP